MNATKTKALEDDAAKTTIKEFLAIPGEALPAAQFIESDDEGYSAWPMLRDYVRPVDLQAYNHCGEFVRLRADRDGWREGKLVRLG